MKNVCFICKDVELYRYGFKFFSIAIKRDNPFKNKDTMSFVRVGKYVLGCKVYSLYITVCAKLTNEEQKKVWN